MKYEKLISKLMPAHSSNYGRARGISTIKYIVIHYTGNDGDTDEANIRYFTSPNRKASAHFFVDDDSISQSVPITNIAYHCGGTKYTDTSKTGGGTMYKIVTNANSIGIEMCDTEKNGVYNLTNETRKNVIKLVKALMKDLNIPIENVVRHFDVTGKHCPAYFMDDKEWFKFKAEITEQTTPATPTTTPSTTSNEQLIWDILMSHFNNAYGVAGLMGNLQAESGLKADNLQNSYNKKLNLTDEEYTEKVDANLYTNFVYDKAGYGLAQWTFWSRKQNLYNALKNKNLSIGSLEGQLYFLIDELKGYKGVYSILKNATSVKQASDIVLTQYEKPADQSDKVKQKRAEYGQNIFDKFASNNFKVKVKADCLNIRAGASTSFKKVGSIKDHGVYTIIETNPAGTWGKLKSGLGWISIRPQYVTKL